MDYFFSNLPLFLELAKQKNYSHAAKIIGISVPTLSRRIKILETEIGIALFVRNTRNVALTESGHKFLQRCELILEEVQKTRDELQLQKGITAGVVKVAMFSELYHSLLEDAFTLFSKEWPSVQLHISLLDGPADLVKGSYDLDIRIGPLPDSTIKARRIATLSLAPYAAPQLLNHYKRPLKPQDLNLLPCVTLAEQGNPWLFTKGKTNEKVYINPIHIANSVCILRQFALAGVGVTLLLPYKAQELELSGKLVRLLPGWNGTPFDVNLTWASRQVPLHVRVFIDFLRDFFADAGLT